MSGRICLDTSAVIKIFRNDPLSKHLLAKYSRYSLAVPVVAELLFAAKNSAKSIENIEIYSQFIDACTIIGTTRKTAEIYSDIRLQLKRNGKPIPENDIWIAAICKEHNLMIATADIHFSYIDELQLYSW